jgi:hypothetical protein
LGKSRSGKGFQSPVAKPWKRNQSPMAKYKWKGFWLPLAGNGG